MRRFKRCMNIIMSLYVVSFIVHVLITAYAVLCMAWLFFYTVSL